jgi:cystathionine beta-synthase
VLPDTGERYLSKLYSDEWLRENRLIDADRALVAELLRRKAADAPELVTVDPGAQVRQALSLLTTHDISQLPVLRDGESVGAVAEATLMARIIEEPAVLERTVESVMEPPFPVVDAGAALGEAARLLTRENPAVLVRRAGTICGIVTRYDMVRRLVGG